MRARVPSAQLKRIVAVVEVRVAYMGVERARHTRSRFSYAQHILEMRGQPQADP